MCAEQVAAGGTFQLLSCTFKDVDDLQPLLEQRRRTVRLFGLIVGGRQQSCWCPPSHTHSRSRPARDLSLPASGCTLALVAMRHPEIPLSMKCDVNASASSFMPAALVLHLVDVLACHACDKTVPSATCFLRIAYWQSIRYSWSAYAFGLRVLGQEGIIVVVQHTCSHARASGLCLLCEGITTHKLPLTKATGAYECETDACTGHR